MSGPMRMLILVLVLLGTALAGESTGSDYNQVDHKRVVEQNRIPVYGFKVIATYPHSTQAYTEGLDFDEGILFEGTGRYGYSSIARIELPTGKHLVQRPLGESFFGEGVTVLGDRVYELTYTTNQGFIYDKRTLEPVGTFHYPYQGWGLTNDGQQLLMSNGSAALLFVDPNTYQATDYKIVHDDQGPVGFLNELEYVQGEVYANVWQTHYIARIDPATGKIKAWLDLEGLNPDPMNLVYPFVLNGIAWNDQTKRLLVTGKCWPHIWEIELVRR